jgi:hypothetical protein
MKARVMTKSTFNTLWVTGVGLLATWLTVSPNNTAPVRSAPVPAERPAALHEETAEDLNAQASKLREHLGKLPLRASTRNPFRFSEAPQASPHPPSANAAAAPLAPVPASPPSLVLSGIAERKTPQGQTRTAIISLDAQLYLVTEGESVAGRYRVVTVDSDAVVLRDEAGVMTRLVFH